MTTSLRLPNAVEVPTATNQSNWATKEDWIRHQELIGQLYRKRPLKEVMDIMASQHGFRATFVTSSLLVSFPVIDVLQGEDVQDTHQAMGP